MNSDAAALASAFVVILVTMGAPFAWLWLGPAYDRWQARRRVLHRAWAALEVTSCQHCRFQLWRRANALTDDAYLPRCESCGAPGRYLS